MSYDAFISYSHAADDQLAPKLQGALQRFAKPWYRRRGLNCFRDKTGLSANPGLWSSITGAMQDSEHFVLLASEGSASSEWVNQEIDYWRAHKPMAKMLPVVTDGEWAWDREANDFDWARCTAVPAALAGAFTEEPRHIDMRWARQEEDLDLRHSRFRDQVAELAAPMYGRTKDELEGDDVRQHRKTLRLAWGAAVALVILTIAAVVGAGVAVGYASEARRNLDEANTQKALAIRNQRIANEQETLAERNARQARRSADEARRQQGRAEQQSRIAKENAAKATQAQGEAESALGEAERQRELAETNEQEAQANAAEAQRNAEEAQRQLRRAVAAEELQRQLTVEAQISAASERLARIREEDAREEAEAQQAIAEAQRAIAEAQTRVAVAEALASQALQRSDADLDLSLLLAVEAARSVPDPAAAPERVARAAPAGEPVTAARNSLLSTVTEAGRGVKRMLSFSGTEPSALTSTAASPDGRYFAAAELTDFTRGQFGGSDETRVHVWDAHSPSSRAELLTGPEGDLTVARLEFGQSGRILFSLEANSDSFRTRIWDVETGELLSSQTAVFAMSPDRRIAVLRAFGTMLFVDANTGETIAVREGELALEKGAALWDLSPEGRFLSGARNFSPGGRYAVGLSGGDQPVLWDLQDGAREIPLQGLSYTDLLSAPVFPVFTENDALAVAAIGPLVAVYDPATGLPVHATTSPTGSLIMSLAVHGTQVAARDLAGHVWVVDTASGDTVLDLDLGLPVVGQVTFSPSGRFLLLASTTQASRTIQLVDVALQRVTVTTSATEAVFSADESALFAFDFGPDLSVTEDFRLRIWDTEGELTEIVPTSTLALQPSQFAAVAGRYVAALVVDDDGVSRPRLWNLASPHTEPTTGPASGNGVMSLSFDGTGDNLFGAGLNGTAVVWDGTRLDPLSAGSAQVADDPGIAITAASRDGVTSAVTRDARTLVFRDMVTKAERPGPALAPGEGITGMSFSPDGAHLVVYLTTGGSSVFRVADGALVGRLPGYPASYSGDGQFVLVETATDSTVTLYRVRDGSVASTIGVEALPPDGSDAVNAYDVDQTGSRIAGINQGEVAVVWDATTGGVLHTLDVGAGLVPLYGVAFSPNGATLATRSSDTALRLWSLSSGALVRAQALGTHRVNGADLAYSPDSTLIAVDGLIVMDAETLQQIGPRLYQFSAREHFFTNDGRFLMTTPFDRLGQVLRWSVGAQDLAQTACMLAGRNLTVDEWNVYMPPGQEPRKTCAQFEEPA